MSENKESSDIEMRRKGLSQKSLNFLQEMLGVINKYNLDLCVSSDGVDLFNLRDANGEFSPYDFIEIKREDLKPYEKVQGCTDLGTALRLMLNIAQLTRE